MILPWSRGPLLQRLESESLRFLYIVAQPGAGVAKFMQEFASRRAWASMSVLTEVDRLSDVEFAQFLRSIRRPEQGRILLVTASDPSFPQPFTDARPGELCIITDEDLALSPREIAGTFRENGVDIAEAAARTVYEMTGGWIAGVTSVLRVWRDEGEAVALDPQARSYHGLRVYVHGRIVSRLSPDELGALVTIVALTETGADVLRHALPATNIDVALAGLAGRRLLLRDGGRFLVPRIVAESIREQYRGDLGALVAQIAADLAQNGDYVTAADVSLSAGLAERGLEYLLQVPMEELLGRRLDFREVGTSLSDAVLCAHPVLWFATLHWRRLRIDLRVLIAEGRMLLETFGHHPIVALLLKSALHIGFCEAGEYETAQTFEAELAAARGSEDLPVMVRASIAGNFATTLSWQGRVTEAARELQEASRLLVRSPMLLSLFMQIHVRKARLDGDWFAEKAFHDRAIAAAEESGEITAVALAVMEAAFGALMAGDGESVDKLLARLRTIGTATEIASFAAFAAIGRGTGMEVEARFGLPRLRGMAHMFHAYSAGSANEARAHLTAAIDEFDGSGYLFGRVLARVALAQLLPRRRDEAISHAKAIAERINAVHVCGALSHLAIGELPAYNQPLRRFVEQMRRFREHSEAPLDVVLVNGTIERDGRVLVVSAKVFLLLAALYARRRPLEREELCEMLWPDMEPQEAANALKMTVRRARLQCGDSNVVRWVNSRYLLGDDVRVDVDGLRLTCEDAIKDSSVVRTRRSELYRVYRQLAKGRPASLLEHEWFVGTEAVLTRLQMELGEALARDVIASCDFANAPELARLMLECDPCDETAWELIIRAHMAAGERESATRALREYRRLAALHLQAAPSPRIEKLLA